MSEHYDLTGELDMASGRFVDLSLQGSQGAPQPDRDVTPLSSKSDEQLFNQLITSKFAKPIPSDQEHINHSSHPISKFLNKDNLKKVHLYSPPVMKV
jgi:hypothetical protein